MKTSHILSMSCLLLSLIGTGCTSLSKTEPPSGTTQGATITASQTSSANQTSALSTESNKEESSEKDTTQSQTSQEGSTTETSSQATSQTSQVTSTTTSPQATSQSEAASALAQTISKLGYQPGQKVLLTRQGQVQQVWNWCAPTTVSVMLGLRGLQVDQATLAKEMGTYEPFGTHNADAVAVLNRHLFGYDSPGPQDPGYRIEWVSQSDPSSQDYQLFCQRFLQDIHDGYPVYLTFDVARMYPGYTGEHNVAGVGFTINQTGDGIESIYYLDPAKSQQDPQYGGLKVTSPEELLYAMLTCQEPNYAW